MAETTDPRAAEYAKTAEADYKHWLLDADKPDNLHDIYRILSLHPDWQNVIAMDEFSQRIIKLAVPPYANAREGDWSEVDDSRTANWLAANFGIKKVSTAMVSEAVCLVADDKRFHPVREYFDALEWDGTPRLEDMLGEYMAASHKTPDLQQYTRLISRMWMMSAVARIYQPGCKADYVLILEGRQRRGKSTFFKILGGAWFSDTPFVVGDKDAYQGLQGKLIIELQEIDSFKKADAEKLKAFFSSSTDNFRPSYGRRNKDFPRQCVFSGTTNQTEYFRDTTGNLRYLPVYVRQLNAKELIRDRDQLWAEAVSLYKKGQEYLVVNPGEIEPPRDLRWWPDDVDLQLMAEQQSMREQADPWVDLIEIWLTDEPPDFDPATDIMPVTNGRILSEVLDMPKNAANQTYQASLVGKIMKKLGWTRVQFSKPEDRKKHGRYYYIKRGDE